jgi:FlaA1/EpsC-like NDP-sugar epimerase
MRRNAGPRELPLVRNRYFFVVDVLLMPLAVGISFLLRLDVAGLQPYVHTLLIFAALAAVVKPVIFYLFGLYRRYWRYASASELVNVALATLTGTAVVTLLMYSPVTLVWDFRPLPRSIPILDWLVSLPLVGGTRFAVRLATDWSFAWMWRNNHGEGSRRRERRVLVMGAGSAGAMIVREMQANPGLGLTPVGLLDDDRAKVGMTIHGVLVQGAREDIPRLVREEEIEEVIIAMPTAPGRAIRDVVTICQQAGVACKTMPGISELISGRVSVRQVRQRAATWPMPWCWSPGPVARSARSCAGRLPRITPSSCSCLATAKTASITSRGSYGIGFPIWSSGHSSPMSATMSD